MPPRPESGVREGLGNEVFAVTVVERATEETVGMARVLGDGGTVYHVADMVVDPAHQRQGLGSRMMDAIDEFLTENAPDGAYVNLMGDVDGFYEQWEFEETRPASKGMYKRVGEE
jgi:GNAT superfamily N-acetyltransferase